MTASPTYSTVITERKIVGAVMLVNFYYHFIPEKKGQGKSAVLPEGTVMNGLYFILFCFEQNDAIQAYHSKD